MAKPALSLLDFKNVTSNQVHLLFEKASQIEKQNRTVQKLHSPVALVFFEPSTRTRMSFEMATKRLGLSTLSFLGGAGSSLEKGETLEDTLLNIQAMKPSLIILRAPDSLDLVKLQTKLELPLISGGWGVAGHPTQALLDAYSIKKFRGRLEGERVLFLGDTYHSRVAASHLELSKILKYEVGSFGPADWNIKKRYPDAAVAEFKNLKESLSWATVVVALRAQLERHSSGLTMEAQREYHKVYGLNPESLKNLSLESLIMHPGPVNYGVEIDESVLSDSRCRILQQVTSGVFIRQSLLHTFLEEPREWS